MTARPASPDSSAPTASAGPDDARSRRYAMVALSNTTVGVLMATIDASIVIISLPAIFRGIGLDPLEPSNISYLLWMLMGYMVVVAVLVVSLGRLGDMYGRVRIYNAGFAVFTVASAALALTPWTGSKAALWLIIMRVVQGIGGAMLTANSAAIITDAFPANRRGMALGINQVAALAGSFLGLVLGGVLSEWNWRAIFWVNVPIGIAGTIWAYLSLRDNGRRTAAKIDWLGNLTFAVGLTSLLAAVTYGIQPYGGHMMGWTNPKVLTALIGGVVVLGIFAVIETRAEQPMFQLGLFRIRSFAAGNIALLLGAVARGGLQFMLIIWLQGIWLPLHGYDYEQTPLWAGIYMLPLTIGFLVAGPVSGALSDRYGAKVFSTGGLVASAVGYLGLLLIPTNFHYPSFALLLLLIGIGSGLFAAPNSTAIMNAVPAEMRGSASGMRSTFMNSGSVLSIGVFFSLMIAGLASVLPRTLTDGLASHGVPTDVATRIGSLPPVGSLFAAFLGYNPVEHLVGSDTLAKIPPADAHTLTGREFFPSLIASPFHHGLVIVFTMAIVITLIAAGASLLRGGRYVHVDEMPATADASLPAQPSVAATVTVSTADGVVFPAD
ncbi:MFS transporter [Pseudofrankia inefficax]|uniref:Major facilitator superfamily MFS_1 n=1 Tax=Pseudofrankia inefficax (strain DSM 45817 / CECT 9037 / DDB 130130 / EuI1c) TaxID=298654 RepID=E3J1X4_PSEI1|nr:MFS transporter [Pseudofrankia inefficax]ADP84079.1 major facilitator superfamily MFS_1 [Pseudofrankia inefficax]